MPAENSKSTHCLTVIQEAEKNAFLRRVDTLFDPDESGLIAAAIAAQEVGLSELEIAAAIQIGIALDAKRATIKPRKNPDPAYWEAVRKEAEEYWDKRYDPNAAEDW